MSSGRKLDVFIVGAGAIARHHARALPAESSRLAGVVEIDAERRAAFAIEHGGIDTFASLEAFLSRDRNRDDLVVVATPPPFHREVVLGVIRSGYHVLCEKPLTIDRAEALELAELAERSGVCAGSCESRFLGYGPVRAAAEMVAREHIGTVVHVEQRSTRRMFRNGIEYQPQSPWFLNYSQSGGGPVLDWGVYDLAVARAVVGGFTRPSVRYARLLGGLSPVPEELREFYDVEEYAYSVSDVSTNNGAPYTFVHERGSVVHGREEHYLRVLGTEGGLEIGWLPENGYLATFSMESEAPGEARSTFTKEYDAHALPIRDMVSAIYEGREPLVSFSQAACHIDFVTQVYDASGFFARAGARR